MRWLSYGSELAAIEGFAADSAAIADLLAQGAYAVHHSAQYNAAYSPHYRIVHRAELPMEP